MPMAIAQGFCITGIKEGHIVAKHRLHPHVCAWDGVQFCVSCRSICPVCGYWVMTNLKEEQCAED